MSKHNQTLDTLKTLFEDKDGNGIPDAFENENTNQTYEVNGVIYSSLDDMPPEHRQLFESLQGKIPFDAHFDFIDDSAVLGTQSKATVTQTRHHWSSEQSDHAGVQGRSRLQPDNHRAERPQRHTTEEHRSNSVQRQNGKSGVAILALAISCICLAVAYFLK